LRTLSLFFARKLTLLFLCGLCSLHMVQAQEDWVNYVVMKDNGVMSVSLDLNLDLNRPNYKNLLIVGGQFSDCMKNGFPSEKGLPGLYAFSDSIAQAIERIGPNRLAGYITYKCMAFDVFYVKDTTGLRDELTHMIDDNFSEDKSYIDIKFDKNWTYYANFLYPRSYSAEFLTDQQYLTDLVLQGDDLLGLRKVNHWIYSKSVEKRNALGQKLKRLKFSLDSIAYIRDREYPFQLTISRQDSITPSSIYELTTMLRNLSASVQSQYDGWSTELRTETDSSPK